MRAGALVFRIHSWLGLASALVLVLIGLSGSVIVFDDQLDRALNPRLLTVTPRGSVQSLDRQMAAAAAARPGEALDAVYLPQREGTATEVYFEAALRRHWLVLVDPYTARVLGVRDAEGGLVRFVYRFHYTLAVVPWGELVVAIVGCLFLVSSVSGLWVLRRALARPFKVGIRIGQGPKRAWSDAHKLVGLATLAFAVMFGVSGVYMMLYAFTPEHLSGADAEPAHAGPRPPVTASYDALFASARRAMPGFHPRGISLPHAPGERVMAYGYMADAPAIWGEYTSSVELDPATARALAARDIRDASLLERYEMLLYQLHFGQYGGDAVRWLYVALGLAPAAMAVSGFVLWRRRRARGRGPRSARAPRPGLAVGRVEEGTT